MNAETTLLKGMLGNVGNDKLKLKDTKQVKRQWVIQGEKTTFR